MDKGKGIVDRRGGGSARRIPNKTINERSKIRILLCDSDVESCQEVFAQLRKCSYQVTPVWSISNVITTLNIEGSCIDMILAEVDLLVANGARILKYIMQNMELQRIPLIMLAKPDQVSVIGKCLRLGADDYLVKPLSENELLNLWVHLSDKGECARASN